MTYDEAVTVTQMIVITWPSHLIWGEEEMHVYACGLMRYDPEAMTKAVAAAQQKLMYRPAVAELVEFYDIERAKLRATSERVDPYAVRKEKVPLWVRRWVAARYMHARFGRERDMRCFPEQQDWGDHYTDLMPADEWLEEADHVTDTNVWTVISSLGS